MRTWMALVLLASAALAAPPAPPAAPPSEAPASLADVPPMAQAPASTPALSLMVRQLLNGRMLRHGTDLGALESAIQAGDFAAVAKGARSIADEPRLARTAAPNQAGVHPQAALPGADTLNQTIPEGFFVLQDLLHDRAVALEGAALARDGRAMRTFYTQLGETCGQCHAAWFPVPHN